MINVGDNIQNLTGKILISTPSISDEYLHKSMVFVCSHDQNGAMGVVINKLIPSIDIKKLLSKLSINFGSVEDVETHFGGIDETERCFILHSDDYLASTSTMVGNNLALGAFKDEVRQGILFRNIFWSTRWEKVTNI